VQLINPSNSTVVLEFTEPLTKMSIRNIPAVKALPAHKAETSPPSLSRLSSFTQRYRPSWSVTGIALLSFFTMHLHFILFLQTKRPGFVIQNM
jgi:hypothetical protein